MRELLRIKPQASFKNWGSIFSDKVLPTDSVDVSGCEGATVPSSAVEAARSYFDQPDRVLLHFEAQDLELRSGLADRYSIDPKCIFVTAATLDGIRYVCDLFARPGVTCGLLSPDFPPYPAFVRNAGAELEVLPSGGFPFLHSAEEILLFLERQSIDLLVLSNPNVCLGNQREVDELESIISGTNAVCVVDEADAMDHASALPLTLKYPNLVVLRSFSKWFGLADMRIGYLACHPSLAEFVDRRLNVCGVSGPSICAARAAIRDDEYLRRVSDIVRANRAQFEEALVNSCYRMVPGSKCFVAFVTGSDAYRSFWRSGIVLNEGRNYAIETFVGTRMNEELATGGRMNFTDSEAVAKVVSRLPSRSQALVGGH